MVKKTDEAVNDYPEDAPGEILAENDMQSLYQHIPALYRRDVQLSSIREHVYPEGGWGWVVVFCTTLAHILTSGALLSGGVLARMMVTTFHPVNHIHTTMVVTTAWSVSLLFSPVISHLCQEYSPRLVAVGGGLIINLAFLFTSFATQLHQVLLSYGLLFGVGCCAVRESAMLMIGQYFKDKREVVEMCGIAGVGLGVIIFSILYTEVVG